MLQMIRNVKQVFLTLLVVGFVMMNLKLYLGPHHLNRAVSTILGGNFEYFTDDDLESQNQSIPSLLLSDQQFSYPKTPMMSAENLQNNSKCSYNVCY